MRQLLIIPSAFLVLTKKLALLCNSEEFPAAMDEFPMEAVPFDAAALVEFAATPEVALLLVELPESAISISLVELAAVLFDEPPDEVLLDEPPGEVLLEEPPDEVLLEEPPEVVLLALVELLASSISIWLVELAEVLLDEP